MLVSVIIPAYNRENTIKDAVCSVLAQTYADLELIVVDDCSKDGTVNVVKEIRDERVHVIECEKNGGACVARNIGIDHAKGEIIAFQDSDDIWHSDKLEKSLKYMEEEDADFVFSSINRIGDQGCETEWGIIPKYNMNLEKNKLQKILYLNCVSTQTIVARKTLFDDIRFDENLPRFQDWDLAIRVFQKGYKTYFIEEPLVDSYVMEDSITANPQKALVAIQILENKYKDELERDAVAYHGFYERAAYKYEDAGKSGARCFWNAFKTGKTFTLFVQFLLSKLRMYRGFCFVKNKFVKKGKK